MKKTITVLMMIMSSWTIYGQTQNDCVEGEYTDPVYTYDINAVVGLCCENIDAPNFSGNNNAPCVFEEVEIGDFQDLMSTDPENLILFQNEAGDSVLQYLS